MTLDVLNIYLYYKMENREGNKTNFYNSISQKIAESRNLRNFTQKQLADKIGITRTALINIEKGRQHLNLFMLFEIAIYLDLEIEDFIPTQNEFELNYVKPKMELNLDIIKPNEFRKDVVKSLEEFIFKINRHENKAP